MNLPLPVEFLPMEVKSATALPEGDGWQYEPKWDGFRCLAFRDGDEVALQSKSGQPLARYFPEVVERLRETAPERFILDGELMVLAEGQLDFDQLLQRIHPAESRIRKLAEETPAMFVFFDLLVEDGRLLTEQPLRERRQALEQFVAERLGRHEWLRLSPATSDLAVAKEWFAITNGALDGVLVKRLDAPYESGRSGAMLKIKNLRTADCVVGGFRYASSGGAVGSLLLGLYDDEGLLHHVGFSSSIRNAERAALTKKLEAIIEPPGFSGAKPGGPSRWSTERSAEWQPLRPELVAEVQYDHFTRRFRHGTKFLRWRPDKAPRQCTLEQVRQDARAPLDLLSF